MKRKPLDRHYKAKLWCHNCRGPSKSLVQLGFGGRMGQMPWCSWWFVVRYRQAQISSGIGKLERLRALPTSSTSHATDHRLPLPTDTYTPSMTHTIGFIGLGVMGRPMAKNLLKAGFPLVVHSRSQGPVDDVVASGSDRALSSPIDVARRATRIFTMLPDSPDVELVMEGPNGVFGALQPGTILIDTSTIAPATARRLASRAAALGATMLDAPVSGGEIGAINASLSIMVGGDADAFAAVKPLLDAMGNPERVLRIGDSGAGQLCKVCNQMVIGGALAVVSEAFALARRRGSIP